MLESTKLITKVGTTINPMERWFELTHTYNEETMTLITKLEIMYRYNRRQEIYTTKYLDFLWS